MWRRACISRTKWSRRTKSWERGTWVPVPGHGFRLYPYQQVLLSCGSVQPVQCCRESEVLDENKGKNPRAAGDNTGYGFQ